MTKHNKDMDKLKSPDIRKILNNNTKIKNKNNNKNRSQMLKAITIKNLKKPTISKIAFATSLNILNVLNK